MRYALINEDGFVTNIVIWDGISEVQWPDGCTAVPATPEHESEWNVKNVSPQSNQTPLTDEEMELLRSLLNRIDANGN
jgi:hypothetical protein